MKCAPRTSNGETLIDKDGLKYHPDTKELYSGKVIKNYMGGDKRFEGSYMNGIKDGFWMGWFENRQIEWEGIFRDGKRVGKWTYYKEDGSVEYDLYHQN